MLLSHEKKFYFIHVPKSAGTSIRETLLPSSIQSQPLRKIYDRIVHKVLGKILGGKRNRIPFTKHVTAEVMLHKHPYLKEYFGFSFVRNPWDREVSLYHYILASKGHYQRDVVEKLPDFDSYIRWRMSKGKDRSQARWTHDAHGKQLVNYIGRYETLSEDFQQICNTLGIPFELSQRNTTTHKDYRSYYTDETAAMVASLYKDDCSLFGYSFEGK